MKQYIICAPSYNENGGGTIAMHRLCHLLNEQGCKAFLWKNRKDTLFKLNTKFNTPMIYTEDLNNYIVVYLEIVSGNPLNAPNVVRWFLHEPGFFTKNINYGKNELYFFHLSVYNNSNLNSDKNNQLYINYINTDLYKQINFKKRKGSCYLIRKGKGRKIIYNLTNSIQIDNLSHVEIAKIFNEKKYFYSYDLHTSYSDFAAMCGCISIVIPQEGLTKEEWQPEKELRYGIAYGEDDVYFALQTQHKILSKVDKLHKTSKSCVKEFYKKTQEYFLKTYKSESIIKKEELRYINYLKNTKDKIVYFGASESLYSIFQVLERNNIFPDYICDNSENKIGKYFNDIIISSPKNIFCKKEKFTILVSSMFAEEIKQQLQIYKNITKVFSIYD